MAGFYVGSPSTAYPIRRLLTRVTVAGERTTLLLLAWPVVRAFVQHDGRGPWLVREPPFFLPATGATDTSATPADEFVSQIPEPIRHIVGQLPSNQWRVLRWCCDQGLPGEQLLEANPALAFIAATTRRRLGRNTSEATRLALMTVRPQTEALDVLGWPATGRVRRLLAKVAPRAVTPDNLKGLKRWCAVDSVAQMLAELPTLDESVLQALRQGRARRLSPPDLRALNALDASRPVQQLGTSQDLMALWRQWLDGQEPRPSARGRARPSLFPAAPFADTDDIVAIRSRTELGQEGRDQHNCVGSLSRSAQTGRDVFYRVLRPERCTLRLRLRGARWTIAELRTAYNRAPAAATVSAVQRWLAEAQAETSGPSGDRRCLRKCETPNVN